MTFIFSYIGNVIVPSDFHIFQRGGSTTNQLACAFLFRTSSKLGSHFRMKGQVSTGPSPKARNQEHDPYANHGAGILSHIYPMFVCPDHESVGN